MDAAGRREVIEKLCSFRGRWPGTDAERRAANWLAERLRSMGRRADVEPTYVHPEYSLVLALHLVLAVGGGLLALAFAPAGFALVLLAATSFYLDQNTRLYILRRLFFRRTSQNVVSPGSNPAAPARLVLSAHYDAAKTGLVFSPRSTIAARRLTERWRLLLGPMRLMFWVCIVPLLLIAGLRMAGIDAPWLDVAQLMPTFGGLIGIGLLVDIAFSRVVPGAYDNASGVAGVLAAAAALDEDPPANLDVWIVFPGAEEANAEGMARWFAAHRKEIDPERTFFLNLDSLSYGHPHYLVSEGAVVSYRMDRRLLQLCEAVAEAEPELAARPVRIPFHSDALPATARGFRATSILGLEEGVGPPWYHNHGDAPDKLDDTALDRCVVFTVSLVRALDRDIARQSLPAPEPAHRV
ncbi:MAG TPA: M28 family peptidase [Solirubrobacterales bacterium]|nr:M28 family peptidase [Solirubrobacterales bacterium]